MNLGDFNNLAKTIDEYASSFGELDADMENIQFHFHTALNPAYRLDGFSRSSIPETADEIVVALATGCKDAKAFADANFDEGSNGNHHQRADTLLQKLICEVSQLG